MTINILDIIHTKIQTHTIHIASVTVDQILALKRPINTFPSATRNDFVNDIVNDRVLDAIFATLKAIVDDIVTCGRPFKTVT